MPETLLVDHPTIAQESNLSGEFPENVLEAV